jgi:hypothetical protein
MKTKSNFDIKNLGLIQDSFYIRPEDELNELSSFEIGLKQFCFDYNSEIIITIGDINQKIHLYHDILDALEEEWCLKIIKLAECKEILVDLGDFSLKMNPDLSLELVNCVISKIGTSERYDLTLYIADVVEKMSNFVNNIFAEAISKKYIEYEDIHKYLGWKVK